MNSTMITANYGKYLSAMEKNEKAKLVKAVLNYHEAGKSGNSEALRSAYQVLLNVVQAGERTSSIRLIHSPDGSYLCALNALTSQTCEFLNRQYTVSFSSLQQANDWLATKRNIILTGVKIQTRTTLGLFANHSQAAQIHISFRASWDGKQYRYGICQQEKTQIFMRSKNDNRFAGEWEAANPGLKCVFLQQASNSRASSGSMAFGFGLDYVEHIKYFITYRMPLSA